MAKSKIEVRFMSIPIPGNYLGFGNSLSDYAGNIREIFLNLRTQNNQTTIGISTADCAFKFYEALQADYTNSGLYSFSVLEDTVTITSTLSNAVFTLDTFIGVFYDLTIVNEIETLPISITSITFSTFLADPQNKVTVSILTSVLADSYLHGNTTIDPNTTNPIVYQMLRGQVELFTAVQDTLLGSNIAQYSIQAPDILASGNIIVNLVNTPTAATATIYVLTFNHLILQYSLNGTTWQSSNVFTGLLPGNYTVYLKDQFGGNANKDFEITVFVPLTISKEEFSYISKAMSIRYKRNQEWDYNDIYRTPDNTLSCEEDCMIAYKYKQKFKPTNVVKTQFLSNYATIEANVIKNNGTKDALTVVKKINFTDIKDKRDARMYKISTGKLGIYFTSGNTYDYSTGIDNGNYALNGALPDYGAVGNYIGLGLDGWFLIEDIIYNESLNVDVLVVSKTYNGFDYPVIVYANYNKKNFNVYEFVVDFSQYNNQEVQIEILQTSVADGYTPYNYLSEILEVTDYWLDSVEIKWANETDTMVFYSTGIHNIGNFEFTTFELGKDSTLEIHKTPYASVVIEAQNYELRELLIEDVSTEIAQQLIQIALHKYICINGVRYISQEPPALEPLSKTNLYSVTLNLLRLPPTSSYQAAFPG
jgi:hypothetical protein